MIKYSNKHININVCFELLHFCQNCAVIDNYLTPPHQSSLTI